MSNEETKKPSEESIAADEPEIDVVNTNDEVEFIAEVKPQVSAHKTPVSVNKTATTCQQTDPVQVIQIRFKQPVHPRVDQVADLANPASFYRYSPYCRPTTFFSSPICSTGAPKSPPPPPPRIIPKSGILRRNGFDGRDPRIRWFQCLHQETQAEVLTELFRFKDQLDFVLKNGPQKK